MSEYSPFYVQLDNFEDPIPLTEENHHISFFRDPTPMDADHLAIRVPDEMTDDDEIHAAVVFRQRQLFLWMGNLAVREGDQQMLDWMNEQHGTFRERSGFNSHVFVFDSPNELEQGWYEASTPDDTQKLLQDLNDTDFIPEDWLEN